MPLSLDEGKAAVALARRTLDAYVTGTSLPPTQRPEGALSERRGVFVTLNLVDSGEERLRGCVGFPYPVKKLGDAITEATEAASGDPRFPPVGKRELDSIAVEVSVLTVPEEIDAVPRSELYKKVRIGTDGLIVSDSIRDGLLLPLVATEFGMDQMQFVAQTCIKAGLPPDAWLDEGTKVEVFQAEIFKEEKPRGVVVRSNGVPA